VDEVTRRSLGQVRPAGAAKAADRARTDGRTDGAGQPRWRRPRVFRGLVPRPAAQGTALEVVATKSPVSLELDGGRGCWQTSPCAAHVVPKCRVE
jgi:hypothetical protein